MPFEALGMIETKGLIWSGRGSRREFLILTTPGGFEGFATEMGEPALDLSLPEPSAPNMEKLAALAAKYRIEILGPLPK